MGTPHQMMVNPVTRKMSGYPQSYADYPRRLTASEMAATDNVILGPLARELFGKHMISSTKVIQHGRALREITLSQSYQKQMPVMPPQLQFPPQKSPSPEAASTIQAPKESLGSPRSTPSSVRISKDSSPPAQVEKKARQTRSKPTPILMKRPLSSVNSTVRRRY